MQRTKSVVDLGGKAAPLVLVVDTIDVERVRAHAILLGQLLGTILIAFGGPGRFRCPMSTWCCSSSTRCFWSGCASKAGYHTLWGILPWQCQDASH